MILHGVTFQKITVKTFIALNANATFSSFRCKFKYGFCYITFGGEAVNFITLYYVIAF
jgi:hypothetical protein